MTETTEKRGPGRPAKKAEVEKTESAAEVFARENAHDWDKIDDAEKARRVDAVAAAFAGAVAAAKGLDGAYAVDPENPDMVRVRVKQSMIVTHPEKGWAEHVQLKPGANNVPRWAADSDIVQANLDR